MTPATIFKERRLARGLLRKESCHSEKPRDFGPIIDLLIALIVIKEFYIEDACKNNATENYKFVQKIWQENSLKENIYNWRTEDFEGFSGLRFINKTVY